MEYTPPPAPASPLTIAALAEAFATLPDPRRAQGRRFPLAALLTLAVAAILANHLSVLAIAEWGKAQSDPVQRAFGFTRGVMPHQSTLQRLFARLDASALAAAFAAAVSAASAPPTDAPHGIAIDGKAHRGRLAGQSPVACPIHMLSAVCHTTGAVLAQMPVQPAGDKPAAELATAPALVAALDWRGRVFTGDALYCQRDLCAQIVGAGGDYLMVVKVNQPALHRDLATLFAHRADPALRAATLPAWDMRDATQADRGHGRDEQRTLVASTELNAYLDWPHLAQVLTVERVWREGGVTKQGVRYAVTSLPPAIADARRLLALVRGHWQIENGVHYVKDETLGEDRSQVRTGQGPNVLAILRDTALTLLRQSGCRTVAARLRHHCRYPTDLFTLLGISP